MSRSSLAPDSTIRSTNSVSRDDSNLTLPISHVKEALVSDKQLTKHKKVNCGSKYEDFDGETCPICLDYWSNSGAHRLAALKCGHLFGSKCVRKWLKAQRVKERSCPICKCKAALKDVRFIYARRIVATDSSQITALQKQVEILKMEKSRKLSEVQKFEKANRAVILQLRLEYNDGVSSD